MDNLLALFESPGAEKSNPPPQLDAAMALQHLALLGKDEASSFLGAYRPNGSRKNLKPWTGPFSALDTAQRKNQEGRGLYLCINNGSGLKDADIQQCVALWSEDDKGSKDEQLERWLARMPVPTFIVETSKSLHIYLVLKQPIAPAVWKPIQSRLIDFVDGDPAVKSLSRVLRLRPISSQSWLVLTNCSDIALTDTNTGNILVLLSGYESACRDVRQEGLFDHRFGRKPQAWW